MILYIVGKLGKRGAASGGCPVVADCYLCPLSGCRSYADGSYRVEVNTADELELVKSRANIIHYIQEGKDNGYIGF